MDTRTKRPMRSAVSLGLGVALVATAGVVAVTPVVTALASQGSTVTPAAGRPAPAALHATVVRTALPSAVTPHGQLHGVSCADAGCTLTAMKGSVVVHDSTPDGKQLDVWKFVDTTSAATQPGVGASSAGAASAVLEGTVGVPMTITIHNTLGQPVGLSIPQLDGVNLASVAPAVSEVPADSAPAQDAEYTFVPDRAGTYLYQAGLTANGSRQAAMGLVGALVVRPSSDPAVISAGVAEPVGQEADQVKAKAYDAKEATSAYADEAVLVYTDVDSAMAADPIAFNMRSYRPDYHLINGQAYPDVPSIGSAPGNVVMLRVVNGSILEKSPTILGTRLIEFATGSRPLPTPLSVSGRMVQTGDTLDALVTMPADPVRYAIYDAPGSLRNGDEVNLAASTAKNAPALGGGMVLIDSGFTDGGLTGAAVTNLRANGQPGSRTAPLEVSADLTRRDAFDVTAAELYLDSLAGTPIPIDVTSPTPPCGPSCHVTVTLDGSVLGGLTSGVHPVWVRAQTGNSAWGPYALIKIRVDNDGPAVTSLALSSSHVNGTRTDDPDVDITATFDERTTGGSNVRTAARFWIGSATDTDPDAASFPPAITVRPLGTNGPRLVAAGSATLARTDIAALTKGSYTLWVQAQDEPGTWGKAEGTPLVVDRDAPITTMDPLDPTITNGQVGSASKPASVIVTATVADSAAGPTSDITSVEGFVGAVDPVSGGANSLFFAPLGGGRWRGELPLAWLAGRPDGAVTVFVVGTDAAGNRSDGTGPNESKVLTLDKTSPQFVSLAPVSLVLVGPNRGRINFSTTISDTTSGIAFAEYFVGADPGQGAGTAFALNQTLPYVGTASGSAMTNPVRAIDVTFTSFFSGTVPITVRSRDVAGNWSQKTVRLAITRNQVFLNGFDAPAPRVAAAKPWNTAPSGRTTTVTAGRIAGQRSLSAAIGVVGYYTENLVKLGAGPASDLHALFLMAPGRTSATGCATAGAASRCAPRGVTVFTATTAKGGAAVAVQYGRASATSRVQFRLGVLRSTGAMAWGAWTTVKAAKTYDVRVDWASGAKGAAILHVNSTKALSKVTVSNASVRVTAIHVGVVNRVAKARGAILFDTVSIA